MGGLRFSLPGQVLGDPCEIAVKVVHEVEGYALQDLGCHAGPHLWFAVMAYQEVLEQEELLFREPRQLLSRLGQEKRPDDKVAQKPPPGGVVVVRSARELPDLADVVEGGPCRQQRAVEQGPVMPPHEFSELHDREGVLQKASREGVVKHLGGRAGPEARRFGVIQGAQGYGAVVRVGHALQDRQELAAHGLPGFCGTALVILRVAVGLVDGEGVADRELQIAPVARDLPGEDGHLAGGDLGLDPFHVVPDLARDNAGTVHQLEGQVRGARAGLAQGSRRHEQRDGDIPALGKVLDEEIFFHAHFVWVFPDF
jgi:hypothetical protein